MKYLYKLKKEQYREGAEASFSNAKDHLVASKLCATNSLHGIAHSHLVIACEELSKASILKVKSLIPQARIKDLKDYFISHKVKHKKVWEIYVAVCELPEEESSENLTNNKQEVSNNSGWKTLLFVILALAIIAFINNGKDSKEMSLEEMRLRGFYVDLTDDKIWLIPNQIFSLDKFNEHLQYVETIFQEIEKRLFNSNPSIDDLMTIANKLGYVEEKLSHARQLEKN